MTEEFQTVLAASERERRDLFLAAANRLGTAEQNIEKDFWAIPPFKEVMASIAKLEQRINQPK